MRQVIRDTFFDFSAKREGFTPFPYCDTLNLVTTGIGNLIDNGVRNGFDTSASAMAPAMNLPWKFRGPGWSSKNPVAAGPASPTDVQKAWIACKLQEQSVPGFNKRGGFAYAGLTNITLDMDGLKNLFNTTLNKFDATIASRYPGYETWPADAQNAILSMAWAMGPGFNFPGFKAAVDRLDFRSAAIQSFFKGGGGTLEPSGGDPTITRKGRNLENYNMFNTAADVLKGGIDPDRLFFPGTVSNSAGALSAKPVGPGTVPVAAASTTASKLEKTALIGGGAVAVGFIGWEALKWWDGRRGKR